MRLALPALLFLLGLASAGLAAQPAKTGPAFAEETFGKLPDAKDKKGRPAVPELSWSYAYEFTPVMEQRLSQAGVRLAAYLNAIYASPQPLPANRPR